MADPLSESPRPGYSYHLSDQQIVRWAALPAEAKLQWLEEALRLLAVALTPEARQIQHRFRRGEL